LRMTAIDPLRVFIAKEAELWYHKMPRTRPQFSLTWNLSFGIIIYMLRLKRHFQLKEQAGMTRDQRKFQ
jgi:hypothetical protein